MAKRIRNFVDRSFARTVDLELLHRLLEPYLGQIGFDWNGLPEDDGKRREAIFGLFAKADLRFPAKLQFALYNISTLSTDAGARIIQEIAPEAGVDVLSAYRIANAPDDLRFTPRFMALVTWLDHRAIFDRALSAAAFLAHSTKLERDAEREDVELRHHDAGVQDGFAEAARLHFAGRYNGHYCDVRWFEEEDLLRVLILHGSKPETKNVDQEGAEDTLKFREIVQSTIEYDQRRSAIAVGSKSATDAKKLVKLFGEHVLGDGDIFEASAKEELYTLAPLQSRGAAFRFAFQPEGEITHVALREVRVDEAQMTTTGRLRPSPWYLTLGDSENALRRLQDVAPEIDVGDVRIVHAKVDVTIEVDDSDRHPIRSIGAADLQPYDPRFVRSLRNLGILAEREDLRDDGTTVLQVVDDTLIAIDPETGACERHDDALDVQTFDINLAAICRAIREQSRLEGPGPSTISARVMRLGRYADHGRAAEICLVRRLREATAQEIVDHVRGAIDTETAIMLVSLGRCDLSTPVARQLDVLRMAVASAEDLLRDDAENPLAMDFSRIRVSSRPSAPEARLVVDRTGRRVICEGVELAVEPRDFDVLVLLVDEAADAGGWVLRDSIAAALRASTGRDGNPEQVDRSINRLRDVFRKEPRLPGLPKNGFIETKSKVGCRLTFAASEIGFMA